MVNGDWRVTRMTHRTLATVVSSAGALLFFSSWSEACSCGDVGPPCQAFMSAKAVFAGRVVRVLNVDRKMTVGIESFVTWGRRAQFEVERAYKGIKAKTVELETGGGGGDCGYGFQEGKRYLVYAHGDKRTTTLETNICTRTREVNMAADDLDYLNALPNSNATTRISGSIWHVGNELNNFAFVGPMVWTRVVLEGQGKPEQTSTDVNGVYRALGLPPGKYSLKFELPSNLALAFWNPKAVSLRPRSCAGYDVYVESNGRISGRVINSNGEGVQKIKVDLISADPRHRVHDARSEYAFPRGKWEFTRADGGFLIRGIPPGQYLLGFSLDRPPSDSFPYPTAYYPGVAELSRAAIIEMGDGELKEGFDFQLPERLSKRTVKGRLLFSDGQPVENGGVFLNEAEHLNLNWYLAASQKIDADGQFTLEGFEGRTVWVHGYGRLAPGNDRESMILAAPVKTIVGDIEEIRLVVSLPK